MALQARPTSTKVWRTWEVAANIVFFFGPVLHILRPALAAVIFATLYALPAMMAFGWVSVAREPILLFASPGIAMQVLALVRLALCVSAVPWLVMKTRLFELESVHTNPLAADIFARESWYKDNLISVFGISVDMHLFLGFLLFECTVFGLTVLWLVASAWRLLAAGARATWKRLAAASSAAAAAEAHAERAVFMETGIDESEQHSVEALAQRIADGTAQEHEWRRVTRWDVRKKQAVITADFASDLTSIKAMLWTQNYAFASILLTVFLTSLGLETMSGRLQRLKAEAEKTIDTGVWSEPLCEMMRTERGFEACASLAVTTYALPFTFTTAPSMVLGFVSMALSCWNLGEVLFERIDLRVQ